MRALLYGVLLVLGSSAAPLSASPQTWGKPVHGLRIAISLDQTSRRDPLVPGFRVDFRNGSPRDFALDMGIMTAYGKYSRALFLIITDAQGKSHRFDLIKPVGIVGHPNAFIVPLAAGTTHSIPVDLGEYWAALSGQWDYKLQPGTYDIQARFIGIDDVNGAGEPGSLRLWTGTVASNHLRFEITEKQ